MHVAFAHVRTQVTQNSIVYFKVLGDRRASAEVKAGETAHAGFVREEHIGAEQGLFKLAELGRRNIDVRSNATAASDLTTAVGELDLAWMLRDLALVVILVERDRFVIALNEAAAGRVIARGGQSQTGVFAQRRDRLHEPLAES